MVSWTEPVALAWLVAVVNEYGARAREEAGEADAPYPDPTSLPAAPVLAAGLDVPTLVTVADRLHPAFAAASLDEAVATLDDVLAASAPRPRANLVAGAARLGWEADDRLDAILAACAIALVAAVADPARAPARLGECDAGGCCDVYVDRSPARTRRYCSTTCQTREKVAAYRRRQRT